MVYRTYESEKNMEERVISEGVKHYASIYREVGELIGPENTKKIFECFKGQQVTFPQRLYDKQYVTEYVKIHYDGTNLKELALKFSYTERYIREMLKDEKGDYLE